MTTTQIIFAIISAAVGLVGLAYGIRTFVAGRSANVVVALEGLPEESGAESDSASDVLHVVVQQAFVVRNLGRAAARDVVVRLLEPRGKEEPVRPLAPGESQTVLFSRRAVDWRTPADFEVTWTDDRGARRAILALKVEWAGPDFKELDPSV